MAGKTKRQTKNDHPTKSIFEYSKPNEPIKMRSVSSAYIHGVTGESRALKMLSFKIFPLKSHSQEPTERDKPDRNSA